MPSAIGRTFVGIGFGPIQSALFLYEAFVSGRFARYVVAEVDAALVAAVRGNGGAYTINIARRDRIDQVRVGGVEIYNPGVSADREAMVAAIAEADELGTALPSVKFYDSGDGRSIARLLGEGFERRGMGKASVIYTAENNNHAAEILTEALRKYATPAALRRVQALNTVIGKMSGVIAEGDAARRIGSIAPMAPSFGRAVLVEEFNRILISRIRLEGFERGIDVFVEKDDLLPFEEAKLYGHNAIHAMIGYLADLRGLGTMAEAGECADLMDIARRAFIDESGVALCRKHGKLGESLFTAEGFAAYAEDLLDRMIRPNLNDLISRVTRDHVRKLGYDDRLFGTMRLALSQGIEPVNLARGAAAGVLSLLRHRPATGSGLVLPESAGGLNEASLGELLRSIWGGREDSVGGKLVGLTWKAIGQPL